MISAYHLMSSSVMVSSVHAALIFYAANPQTVAMRTYAHLDTGGCLELVESAGQMFRERRSFLLSPIVSLTSVMSAPLVSQAAKGAAEYDFEYYLRDIFLGNNPEGNLPATKAPPPQPPRTLLKPLLPLLLDQQLQSCIAIQQLALISNIPIESLANQVVTLRSKVQPAFFSRYPWKEESVADQYYFDLTAYSLWKVASFTVPDYAQRDLFVRTLGRNLLQEMLDRDILGNDCTAKMLPYQRGDKGNPLTLTDTIPCILKILSLFQSINYCSSYRLGDMTEVERTERQVFDELDNQSLLSPGGYVNCLVSIRNPATLGGALQITGEGSRFAPDFVGPTLAAVWERVGHDGRNPCVEVTFESYFVDPVYRPNPKDFFPDERLYQFTIMRK